MIPVLGRPQNAAKVAHSLHLASPKVRLVFIVSSSDPEQLTACQETGADVVIAGWEPEHGDFARKIHLGYQRTSEPWIFQGADDVIFEKGWDQAALACAEETGALVIGTWDGGNPMVMRGKHSTHTLIARSYCDDPGASFDGPGTVFSEAYAHQSVDVELIELAKHRRVWTFCSEAKVIHKHPFWENRRERLHRLHLELDSTYQKGLADGRADARLFAQRHRAWLKSQRTRA